MWGFFIYTRTYLVFIDLIPTFSYKEKESHVSLSFEERGRVRSGGRLSKHLVYGVFNLFARSGTMGYNMEISGLKWIKVGITRLKSV